MRTMHGFWQKGKRWEDFGHILLELALPGLGWVREWTTLRIGKWKIGQWPPGDPWMAPPKKWLTGLVTPDERVEVTELDRVSDMGRDHAGYMIAHVIDRVVLIVLAVLLWWRW